MIALRMLHCRVTEIGWYHRVDFDSRINPRFERTKVGTNDPSMDRSIKRAAVIAARQGEAVKTHFRRRSTVDRHRVKELYPSDDYPVA